MGGQEVCINLRAGLDPWIGDPLAPTWPQSAMVVEAAQHELCPDTLHQDVIRPKRPLGS